MCFVQGNWNLHSVCFCMLKWDCFKQSDCGEAEPFGSSISASALFCAFCSDSYCVPNGCCVRSKHKHFLFRILQLPIQHRGVVPFSSLASTLMPEESWERSWSMLIVHWARALSANENSRQLMLLLQHGPSYSGLMWWAVPAIWAAMNTNKRPAALINHKLINEE